MLNYLSAEWYKLRKTKGIFVAFGVLLALIFLIFLPKFWYVEPSFGVYAAAYLAFLPVGSLPPRSLTTSMAGEP